MPARVAELTEGQRGRMATWAQEWIVRGLATGPVDAALTRAEAAAGWWWPHQRFVMVCERPTELHLGWAGPGGVPRLHNPGARRSGGLTAGGACPPRHPRGR